MCDNFISIFWFISINSGVQNAETKLQITVMDQNKLEQDNFLAKLDIPLKDIANGVPVMGWFTLPTKGKIRLHMQFSHQYSKVFCYFAQNCHILMNCSTSDFWISKNLPKLPLVAQPSISMLCSENSYKSSSNSTMVHSQFILDAIVTLHRRGRNFDNRFKEIVRRVCDSLRHYTQFQTCTVRTSLHRKLILTLGRYMSVLAKQFKPNKPYIDWLEETLNIVDRLTPDQKNLLTTTEARIYFAILSTNMLH